MTCLKDCFLSFILIQSIMKFEKVKKKDCKVTPQHKTWTLINYTHEKGENIELYTHWEGQGEW